MDEYVFIESVFSFGSEAVITCFYFLRKVFRGWDSNIQPSAVVVTLIQY